MSSIERYRRNRLAVEWTLGIVEQLDELTDLMRGESEGGSVTTSTAGDGIGTAIEQMDAAVARLLAKVDALNECAEKVLDTLRTMDGDADLLFSLFIEGRTVRQMADQRNVTPDAIRKARDRALVAYGQAERHPRPIG